jgi:hypothetical protein
MALTLEEAVTTQSAFLFRAKRINHCNDFVARVALEVVDSSWWKQQLRVKSAGSGIAVVITQCHAVLVPTALSAAVALISARSARSVGSSQPHSRRIAEQLPKGPSCGSSWCRAYCAFRGIRCSQWAHSRLRSRFDSGSSWRIVIIRRHIETAGSAHRGCAPIPMRRLCRY